MASYIPTIKASVTPITATALATLCFLFDLLSMSPLLCFCDVIDWLGLCKRTPWLCLLVHSMSPWVCYRTMSALPSLLCLRSESSLLCLRSMLFPWLCLRIMSPWLCFCRISPWLSLRCLSSLLCPRSMSPWFFLCDKDA